MPFKCQGHPVGLWRWPLTYNLEKCYSLTSSFGVYNLERRLRYVHLLTRHCPCNKLPEPTSPKHEFRGKRLRQRCDVIDNVITMEKMALFGMCVHIWGQIESVFNISKFSKWLPFLACDKLFYRKWYRKLNIPDMPLAFPTFWAFDRCSSPNIDGDMSISKFDPLCDLVMSPMTSWIGIDINAVIVSWYLCTGSLMISLLINYSYYEKCYSIYKGIEGRIWGHPVTASMASSLKNNFFS